MGNAEQALTDERLTPEALADLVPDTVVIRNHDTPAMRRYVFSFADLRQFARALLSAQADSRDAVLKDLKTNLQIMLASAVDIGDEEEITGYQIKTGALHRILGIMASAGCAVSVPLHKPISNDAAEALKDFRRAMREETIPAVVETMRKRAEAGALIGNVPLSATPSAEAGASKAAEGFYLASFKRPFNGFVTWWGPSDAGYTPYLDQAGIYAKDKIEAGYHDSEYTVPVPVSFVREFEQRVIDAGMSACGKTFWNAKNLRAAIAAKGEA